MEQFLQRTHQNYPSAKYFRASNDLKHRTCSTTNKNREARSEAETEELQERRHWRNPHRTFESWCCYFEQCSRDATTNIREHLRMSSTFSLTSSKLTTLLQLISYSRRWNPLPYHAISSISSEWRWQGRVRIGVVISKTFSIIGVI